MNSESTDFSASSATQDQLQFINERLADNDYVHALDVIKQIPVAGRNPLLMSAYALCMAEVKRTYKPSVNLCHDAIKREPKNPEHYYRQGRILILAGRRKDAIWVLRMGLRHGRHRGIIETLGALGIRRAPPLAFLARSNPLNKYLGMLLTKLNLR
jgi:hypothetical protein